MNVLFLQAAMTKDQRSAEVNACLKSETKRTYLKGNRSSGREEGGVGGGRDLSSKSHRQHQLCERLAAGKLTHAAPK